MKLKDLFAILFLFITLMTLNALSTEVILLNYDYENYNSIDGNVYTYNEDIPEESTDCTCEEYFIFPK